MPIRENKWVSKCRYICEIVRLILEVIHYPIIYEVSLGVEWNCPTVAVE